MFWANSRAADTLAEVLGFGVNAGQLGLPGELSLTGQATQWQQALAAHPDFVVTTAVCSYEGEDYADIPTVTRAVGLVPLITRAARIARTKAVADLALQIGVTSVACHIGVVPAMDDPVYPEVRELTRELCDYCSERGQAFALETGQESARHLLHFIEDVARPNLMVNFDPANMILYGTGDPLEALEELQNRVISVHCKDGDRPDPAQPDALGQERALGSGSVGIPEFVGKLREIGYTGILSIEREEPNAEQRAADIVAAVNLLKQLTS